ncbi:TonB-dependent receptor [Sphingobacterium alkalisoli]|uniref:TonB-dependent receptor n=1 Tax=Sphingobacterium alkalisoli TaxID=1874115 RepID=A0A4U0H2P5_9SPHI|nr:TonB-dependent receptor [Sphingobacterium alkalisoli]TJY65880.1 TonB-dependent receptor [Sphingobacterium alkalisoli]GGH17692.1 SusC/RagA family TonB-linked outer membrane protein [Sphingobacterium alkalisoli]
MRKLSTLFLLFLFADIAYGQTTVSGIVKDSQSLIVLPGVTVNVKGKNTTTQTDATGNFSITAEPTDELVFTFIGYTPQTIGVGNQTQIDVFLDDESRALDEIVVIGYGTAQKRDLTGSIAQVKGSEIVDRPGTNPVANLQGKVAGLQVTNSGRPGQEPDIRIRGTNSINAVKPLYVVDGLLNDNINFLNPADIESIEVLKDPSSLAIFGVRGANGVIAITTKRAKTGELNFEFSSRLGIKNVGRRMDMLNADQFRELYDEQRFNQGDFPFNYDNWQANTNWQDEIFRNGILNYNNLSVSGATERNSFRMGLGYSVDEGIINHEKHSQITLNLADELKITDNFRTGIVFNGYRSRLPQERGVFGAILAAPIAPTYNEAYGLYHVMPEFQRAQVGNPLIDIEERKNTYIGNNYRAVTNVYGEVDFLSNFTFRLNVSADYGFNQFRSYQGLVSVYNPDVAGDDKSERIGNLLTSVSQEQNKHYKYQSDWLLNYKNSFGKHNLTAMLGYTTYLQGVETVTGRRTQGEGLEIPNDPDYWYLDIGAGDTHTGGGGGSEYRTISYLARALYNFDGRYLINASFRKDGSSAFAKKGKPFQDFFAVGGAWVVTQESFMQDQNLINNLKLKGSYGAMGNQNVGGNRYPMWPILVPGNSAVFGDQLIPAYGPQYIPDENLHWEQVKSWEAGFELAAFKNRLNVEAIYYKKNTDGILVTVPGILGSIPGLSNQGNIENKGLEASARWNQSIADDWNISFGGNITTVKNKVISLASEGHSILSGSSRTTAGYPIAYFWGYEHDGIFQTQTEIASAPTNGLGGGAFLPGDVRYKDIDGNGTIDVSDRTMIGNPTPDLYYGISLSTSYKNFDLGLEFQGLYGNEIMRNWNQNQFATYNFLTDRLNRWNGVGTSNWEPIVHEGRANNRLPSTYYIEDGSFFRLRDVTLAYTFPQETIGKIRLKNLRVFANAQNVFTLSNNSGFTPEIGGSAISFGVDNGTYPVPAIYTLGLNLNF